MHLKDVVVINATNIGRFTDGIGVYVLNLLRELAVLEDNRRFIIYLNRTCENHLRDIRFPERYELRWVSGVVSPDHGFPGHLLRLLYSNYLGLRHHRSVIFITGQLEAIFWRRNQIITVHDIIPLLFGRLHRKQYFYFKYLLRHVVRRARWVITPSHHTRDLLIKHYGIHESGVRVIHHGVRDSLSVIGGPGEPPERRTFILFNSRIVPMKNLNGLLQALALLKEKIPHRLVITGYCPRGQLRGDPAFLRAQRVLGPERVEFRGHVSGEELDDLLSRAALLAFPSFYEGFGLPPLEGMAHGCPVLVSNISSLPEVCGDAARYVDPTDARSIADGIYQLLTDNNLCRDMVTKGLVRARQFQWRDSALRHLNVFDEASAPGPDSPAHSLPVWRTVAAPHLHSLFSTLITGLRIPGG